MSSRSACNVGPFGAHSIMRGLRFSVWGSNIELEGVRLLHYVRD